MKAKLRGNVIKYLPVFRQYVQQFGFPTVRQVLKTGHCGDKFRLKLPINMKDRDQILKQLENTTERTPDAK